MSDSHCGSTRLLWTLTEHLFERPPTRRPEKEVSAASARPRPCGRPRARSPARRRPEPGLRRSSGRPVRRARNRGRTTRHRSARSAGASGTRSLSIAPPQYAPLASCTQSAPGGVHRYRLVASSPASTVRIPIDRREFLRLAGAAALVGAIESCTAKTPKPSGTSTPGVSVTPTPSTLASQSSAAASSPATAVATSAPAVSTAAEVADLDALAKLLGPR